MFEIVMTLLVSDHVLDPYILHTLESTLGLPVVPVLTTDLPGMRWEICSAEGNQTDT